MAQTYHTVFVAIRPFVPTMPGRIASALRSSSHSKVIVETNGGFRESAVQHAGHREGQLWAVSVSGDPVKFHFVALPEIAASSRMERLNVWRNLDS